MRSHFAKLRMMCEDLASVGSPPSEDEFYAIILGSLLSSYDPYISALNATSSVLGSVLSSDNLMQTITVCGVKRNNTKRDSSFTWASPEVTLFRLFQLFKGGDFPPVDYLSLSNKR